MDQTDRCMWNMWNDDTDPIADTLVGAESDPVAEAGVIL